MKVYQYRTDKNIKAVIDKVDGNRIYLHYWYAYSPDRRNDLVYHSQLDFNLAFVLIKPKDYFAYNAINMR